MRDSWPVIEGKSTFYRTEFNSVEIIPVLNSLTRPSRATIGSRELQTFDLYVDVVAGVSGNDRLQGS